jgi:phage FluMu gp28-like protein
MSDEKTGRLITEEEWRAHRLASLAAAPEKLAREGGIPTALISYQQRLLATTAAHQVTVVEKSRRTGITWAAGADAVLTSAADFTAGGMDTLYIGYNLDMAREFVDTCAMWARTFMRGAAAVEEFLFQDDKPDKFIQAFRIKFASGFEIVALASRPRSLRGRQGYVIIDEAAFHDDLDGVMTAALALLIWGGKVLVISTHDAADNPFNKLILDIRAGRKPYALMRIDFDDALSEGLYERICFVTNKVWSPEAEAKWRSDIVAFYGDSADEELFCIPSEGDGAWLSAPLIEARQRAGAPVLQIARKDAFTHWPEHLREADVKEWCERELLPLLSNLDPQLNHYLGGDYGRVSDLSVLWPLAVTKTMKRVTPFVVEMKNIPFDQQKQILKYICDRLPRLCAQKHDATGLGMAIAEFAVQKYGEHRCEAVMLSQNWYRENAQPLKSGFEDDAIEIPMDADIASDLRLVAVKNGVAHIPPLKSGVKKDRHGDAAVALMLAWAATRASVAEYGYEPVRSGPSGEADWLFPESSSAGRSLW